jgi:hypothetical protein
MIFADSPAAEATGRMGSTFAVNTIHGSLLFVNIAGYEFSMLVFPYKTIHRYFLGKRTIEAIQVKARFARNHESAKAISIKIFETKLSLARLTLLRLSLPIR